MNVLLSLLQKSPDYMQLLQAVEAKQAAAVSGLSQAPRSHVLAALHEHSGRPLVAVCQDDLAASRLASELGAFLGEQPPVLPSRELTLAGAIGVSRQWEQKRLRLLYALAQGQVPVLVTSLDALLLRTMPREVLFSASVRLRCGAEYNVDDLVARLTRAGYTRSSLVEGVGQFALRGGILDVYSPACENPLRAEFFGDELDTMGYFDPITQRRTENVEEAVLLPVAETEAHLHPQGTAGLCEDLRAIIARQQRRKTPNQALIDTLQKDCEALENETLFASADRYMALIYPEFTTAAAYLSQEAVVAFCDHGNLQRAEKEKAEEFGLLLDSFLTSGTLFGELCDYYGSIEDLAAQLRGRAVVYCDGFLAARYPESLPPKKLLSFTARQLPGRERQELFGRQALGIPGREEAVAVDDRPAAQLRGQILDRAVIIAQFAKQRAGGQERIEQQAEFLRLFLLRPLQIPVITERDDRLLRQICGSRGELRIDERHIAVGAGKERLVLKCFAVLLQGVDQRLIGRFPALLARDDRAQVLAQPRRALRVQMRLRLRHGQEDGLFHVFRAPLGDGVKIAHGVELVAEKLRAQRVFARGRIHVQNAAAQGELPHALDEARAGIARPRQPGDQIVHVVFRPAPQPHGRREQDLPRHRAQQQRVQARHQNRHLPLRQRVQQPQPLLLPLPRDADGSRERQLARRQHRRLLAQKRAELRRKPGSRQIILTHRDERAARMLVQRREHMAPRRLA